MELKDLRISREDAVLVVVDYQEKLVPAMEDRDFFVDRASRMAKGANELGLPKLVTEQYAKGLGSTISEIAEALGEFSPIDKNTFSAYRNDEFKSKLDATGKKTVLLMGIETHICVFQTAYDLLESGYKVVLLEDCCSSRNSRDAEWGTGRMALGGVIVTTMEAALMEMIGGTSAAEFKGISKIIK